MYKTENEEELSADVAVRDALAWEREKLPRDRHTGLLNDRFTNLRDQLDKKIHDLTVNMEVNVGP